MLRELRIKNFAVIESVTVPLTSGLNVLTGETGAGKSMLIDALLLVRGARAQSDVIRAEAETATVEAIFAVDGHAAAVLHDAGLAADDGEIVIRRELSRSGRHRAFVNDSPVTVGLLERLGDELVEVHGQHEHQRLLQASVQLAMLDRFADTDERPDRVAALFAKYRAAADDVERTRAAARDRAQREDLLRFQVAELNGARLRAGEEAELRTERRRAQHAERLMSGLAEVTALLDEDGQSAQARLARALRVLGELGRIDPAFAAPADALEGARLQVEDALATMRNLRDGVITEPGRLEAIDDRLDALARLKRKYGDTEETMIRFAEEAAVELDRLARHEQVLAQQERALADVRAELVAAANLLSETRRTAASRLSALVEKQMHALGMDHAVFQIAVEAVAFEAMTARGLDRAEFRLCTNAGEDMRPLARVASGGELSRTMLALKAVLAQADRVPTMIFDEVDAGIGGRVATAVAQTLAAAAEGRQVLCVTHLAPIAALAHHHVRVAKTMRGGRTRVAAAVLEDDDRVAEVARMLGGDAASATARGHARTLLGGRKR